MTRPLSDEEMQAFIAQAEEAADAYVRGDMDRYLELVHHADTFTLMPPYGGPAGRHGNRDDTVRASTDFIKGGEARLENVETHAWGDTVVMAMTERQYGSVEGRPNQDISLRVTHVYRRTGDDWYLVHRHADPMVESRSLDELMAFMRV